MTEIRRIQCDIKNCDTYIEANSNRRTGWKTIQHKNSDATRLLSSLDICPKHVRVFNAFLDGKLSMDKSPFWDDTTSVPLNSENFNIEEPKFGLQRNPADIYLDSAPKPEYNDDDIPF